MFYGHDVWSGGWLMLLWMFIFWGGLALLATWVLRGLFVTAGPGHPTGTRSAQDIASERYARGEISREEFTELVQDLKSATQKSDV